MKNLKKLSRGEMKTIGGGDEPGLWACCNSAGQCSTPVYGDSNNLVCVDKGTVLTKSKRGLTQSVE